MDKFDEVGQEVYDLMTQLRDAHFPDIADARIKILYSTKERKRGSRVILGSIQKTNELIKYLTKDESIPFEGYDYIILLDQCAWENVEDADRKRILRHELRHAWVEYKDDGTIVYHTIDHDIQDFVAEVTLNADDPGWCTRVASITHDIYEQRKEQEKGILKRRK